METYGIYGSHQVEQCPLFNKENRQLMLKVGQEMEKEGQKLNVNIKERYHSGLEHTFIWIVEAENASSVQDLMIQTGAAKFNSLKIVPLRSFRDVVEILKGLEESPT